MAKQRTEYVLKNTLASFGYQGFILVAGLVSRAVFLTVFTKDFLGASSLFASILSVLSLSEMGVGTAIIQKLYKPLKDQDEDRINTLMRVFQKVYLCIGAFIFVAGLAIMPFVETFVKEAPPGLSLKGIYLMCLLQTASSYLFVYNRSLLTADQRAYKVVGIDFSMHAFSVIMQIIVMLGTRNYYLYFGIGILLQRANDIIVSYIVRRKYYSYLSTASAKPMARDEKKQMLKDVLGLLIYKFSSVSVGSTDSIVISKMFGTGTMADYTNYNTLTSMSNTVVSSVFNAMTPSVGNLTAGQDEENKYSVYMQIHYLSFFVMGLVAVMFSLMSSQFIALWLGEQYIVETSVVIALACNFYMHGCQYSSSVYRNAYGIFWKGKFRPLAMGISNIVLSVLFVKWTGRLDSVFWATVISRLLTTFWYDPILIHKYGLKRSSKKYFTRYAWYVLTVVLAYVVGSLISGFIVLPAQIAAFLARVAVCLVLTIGVFILMTFWMPEFKSFIIRVKLILKKVFYKQEKRN